MPHAASVGFCLKLTQATEDEIAQHAVKLNVFTTMNFMLQQAG